MIKHADCQQMAHCPRRQLQTNCCFHECDASLLQCTVLSVMGHVEEDAIYVAVATGLVHQTTTTAVLHQVKNNTYTHTAWLCALDDILTAPGHVVMETLHS